MKLREHNVSARRIDGEIVVLDLTSSQYFTISGSGVLLYDRLALGATEDELVDAVLTEYEVDAAIARADVVEFVQKLSDAGLVEP
ncbi:MAG: hypothetical protein QOF57_1215 [Frankiaceae bacterium]|jgi:hypothetical protein|nr:hypothetical protein [Frankiaceae bacterium]MDQ1727668.1 hypothetical protein [Frankiaceae bacterium]